MKKPRAKRRIAEYSYIRRVKGKRREIVVRAHLRVPGPKVQKARIVKLKRAIKKRKPVIRDIKERRERNRIIKRSEPVKRVGRIKAPRRVADWHGKILAALEKSKEGTGYEGRVLVARNADGSVDGELRLFVPEGKRDHDVLVKLAGCAVIPAGSWMSLGARYAPQSFAKKDLDRYLMWRGLTDVTTQYGEAKWKGSYFVSAVGLTDDMVQGKGGAKGTARERAIEVVLRLYHGKDGASRERIGHKPNKR